MEFIKKTVYVCSECGTQNEGDRTECETCGEGASQCPSCGEALKISEGTGECTYCKEMDPEGPEEYSVEGMPFHSNR